MLSQEGNAVFQELHVHIFSHSGGSGSNPGSYRHRSMRMAARHRFPAPSSKGRKDVVNQCLEFEEHALCLSVCLSVCPSVSLDFGLIFSCFHVV